MTSTAPARALPAWNPLAIAAFVLSLAGLNVIPIVLSAVALGQIRRTGERGRGLAIAAIWISLLVVILLIAALVVVGIVAGVSRATS